MADFLPQLTASEWYAPTALSSSTFSNIVGLPAANFVVNLIANTVATCAPVVKDGPVIVENELIRQPNSFQTPFEWYHQCATELTVHGNAYYMKVYDEQGFVEQLVPFPTESMNVREVDGFPEYYYLDMVFDHTSILHIKGMTRPGQFKAISPVSQFATTFTGMMDSEKLASPSRSAIPSAVIKTSEMAKDSIKEVMEGIKENWMSGFAVGRTGEGAAPAVVPKDWSIEPLSWSPSDAQFIESRQFNIAVVCLMFGLTPNVAAASIGATNLTYETFETAQEALLRQISPTMQRIEQKLSTLVPVGQVRFNLEKILRANTKARYEAHNLALAGGWLTIPEVRAIEGLPPLPTSPEGI